MLKRTCAIILTLLLLFPANIFAASGDPVLTGASKTAGQVTKWDAAGSKITDAFKYGTLTDSKYCTYTTANGLICTADSTAAMVYPGAGVAVSIGTVGPWDTSLQVGTGANNLVQLNASSQLPAVSAALLTSFPTLNQNTTGVAGGLSTQYIDWNSSSGGTSIANKPTISGTNTGDQNIFASIIVSGQSTITSASTTQALTIVQGSNIVLTTDDTAKSLTITGTGGLVISGQSTGDIIYFDGADWVRLGKDPGKYLQSGAAAVSWAGGTGATTPGGSDTQVQYNDGGVFNGAPYVIYNKATGYLDLNGGFRILENADIPTLYSVFEPAIDMLRQITYTLPSDLTAGRWLMAAHAASSGAGTLTFYPSPGSKRSVRYATTGNITYSGVQTIDGKTTATGDRVLLRAQSASEDNGIFTADDAGAWERAVDAMYWESYLGASVYVEDGDTLSGKTYQCTVKEGGTLGATAVTWVEFAGSGSVATDTIWDAAGDLVQGTGANTAAKLTKGAEGTIPRAGAASLAYTTATYPETTTAYQLLVSTATNVIGELAVGTDGKLIRGVTGAVPSWTTLTMPDTIAAGSVFAANSANVLAAINSTSGTKYLKNAAGTVSWDTITALLTSETIAPSTGSGSLINWSLGISGSPLVAGDYPIVIDHHAGNVSGLSYGVYIKTTGAAVDHSSGFVVENFGIGDGGTFAVNSANTGANASALAAFINNTSDQHDQYALTMLHTHGRSIIIQSQGTGESIEVRRNGNASGTAKSQAHFFIDEYASGNYGHLSALRADAYTSATGSDSQIIFRKGTTETYRVNVDGSTVIGAPSGGGKGAGTINVENGVYVNGTLMTGFSYPGAGLAVSTGSSWGSSITDSSTNWNTAYTDRLKWDGGATGLVAATGRASLGLSSSDGPTFTTVHFPDLGGLLWPGNASIYVNGTSMVIGATTSQVYMWLEGTQYRLSKDANGFVKAN